MYDDARDSRIDAWHAVYGTLYEVARKDMQAHKGTGIDAACGVIKILAQRADDAVEEVTRLRAEVERVRREGAAMSEDTYRGNLRYAFARGAMATGAWTKEEALSAAYLAWPVEYPAPPSAPPAAPPTTGVLTDAELLTADGEALLADLNARWSEETGDANLMSQRDAIVRAVRATPAPLREERYWCGCVRSARWERCTRHTTLDHDEEPQTRAEEENGEWYTEPDFAPQGTIPATLRRVPAAPPAEVEFDYKALYEQCGWDAEDTPATPPAEYATLSALYNDLANECDETRTPDERARLKAAMHALVATPAPRPELTEEWDGYDYALHRETLEICVREAVANVRNGVDVDIWLPTLESHAMTFLQDATALHARAYGQAAGSAPEGVTRSDGRKRIIDAESRLWMALGTYSVQVATTGELAPTRELVDAVSALAARVTPEGVDRG